MRTAPLDDFDHRDGDLVADQDPLAHLARNHEHAGDLHLACRGALAARIWYSSLTRRLCGSLRALHASVDASQQSR